MSQTIARSLTTYAQRPSLVGPDRPALRYGTDGQGDVVAWRLADHPHALITGEYGSGKTQLIRTLGLDALSQGMTVTGYDPLTALGGLNALPGVGDVATSPCQGAELLTRTVMLMRQRYRLLRTGTTPSWPRRLVIIDQMPTLFAHLDQIWSEIGGHSYNPCRGMLHDLLTMGQAVQIHLVLAMVRPAAHHLAGTARTALRHEIALGDSNPAQPFGGGRKIPGRATVTQDGASAPAQVWVTPDPQSLHHWDEVDRQLLVQILRAHRPAST